jgi:hypothetical protein
MGQWNGRHSLVGEWNGRNNGNVTSREPIASRDFPFGLIAGIALHH